MSSKIELLPCPFCGSADGPIMLYDDGFSWVECRICKASGPGGTKYSDEDSPDWNRRSAVPVVELQPVVDTCHKCYGTGVLPARMAGEGETEYRARCKNNVPPELAELQAMIERMAAEIDRLNSVLKTARETK